MSIKTKVEENISPLRVPKAKSKLGLKIPKIAMPHDDLIVADKPKLEIVSNKAEQIALSTLPSHTTLSRQSSMTRQSRQGESNVAPTRDFQKVANSITKQAIPDGFFKGKDKHLYDVLYALTRGAIEPKRSVRISKSKLMKMASIGSRITFDSCIERLRVIGLLKLVVFAGEHEGNEFEILLPEEIKTLTSQSSQGSQGSQTSPAQKLDTLVIVETSHTSQSLNPTNALIYDVSNTSFKNTSKNNDDERAIAFSIFLDKISVASQRITGKPILGSEQKKWAALADLLILELESAASRTNAISSVPAFLTEVLRRKILGSTSRSFSKNSSKVQFDTVGKPNAAGEYEKKPLDEAGREAALAELRDFAGEEFLADFEKWYTVEDWRWLTERLNDLAVNEK